MLIYSGQAHQRVILTSFRRVAEQSQRTDVVPQPLAEGLEGTLLQQLFKIPLKWNPSAQLEVLVLHPQRLPSWAELLRLSICPGIIYLGNAG